MEDILNGDSNAIEEAINREKLNPQREQAEIGDRYYNYKHDILENSIYYINDNDQLVEDPYASNIRIPHAFFTEIVEQSVSTLLSNPVNLETEDEGYKKALEEYWGVETQLFLKEAIEEASKKGKEFAYARQTGGRPEESRITFQLSDSLQTFEVYDETGDVVAVVRFYSKDLLRNDALTSVEHCEIWTKDNVTYYIKNEDYEWELNQNVRPNPRPHILAETSDKETDERILLGKSYGRIPFFKLKNNKKERTDLEPIKDAIDDYDLMNAFMSNNLQDYQGAIYVTKGFPGDDISKLKINARGKGAINVGEDGDFDLKTYNIPVDGRVKKMDLDKENIYKFGMAFDSSQVSDNSGNVTNVQIMAGYSLLMMKLKKKEQYLRMLIDWMLELITEDINRRQGTAYNHSDVEVIIEPELTVNKHELEEIERLKAETKQLKVNTLLDVASFLPQEKVLRELCDILELDWEEVEKLLLEEVAQSLITDVPEEEGEDVAEPLGE